MPRKSHFFTDRLLIKITGQKLYKKVLLKQNIIRIHSSSYKIHQFFSKNGNKNILKKYILHSNYNLYNLKGFMKRLLRILAVEMVLFTLEDLWWIYSRCLFILHERKLPPQPNVHWILNITLRQKIYNNELCFTPQVHAAQSYWTGWYLSKRFIPVLGLTSDNHSVRFLASYLDLSGVN